MQFDFAERIEFLHCIEVNTDNEDLFEEIANDIAEKLDDGYIEDKKEVVRIFEKTFGEENVKFIEDGSGDVEFEAY